MEAITSNLHPPETQTEAPADSSDEAPADSSDEAPAEESGSTTGGGELIGVSMPTKDLQRWTGELKIYFIARCFQLCFHVFAILIATL